MKTEDKGKQYKKRIEIVIAAIIFLLLCVLAVFLYLQNTKQKDMTDFWFDDAAIDGLLQKNDTDIQAILQAKVSEGMFDVMINATPTFYEGGKRGNVAIQNIPANHYPCKVEIRMDDDKETVLYQSAGIKPGQYIDEISLNKKLKSGSYDATAVFTIVDDVNYDTIGEVKVKLTMLVLP